MKDNDSPDKPDAEMRAPVRTVQTPSSEEIAEWQDVGVKVGPEILATIAQSDKWNIVKQRAGTSVYRKRDDNSAFHLFRGETVVDASPLELFNFLKDYDLAMPILDPTYIKSKILKTIDGERSILDVSFSLPWPVYNRSFVYLEHNHLSSDETPSYSACRSVRCDAAGKIEKRHVRGEILASGYVWKPTAEHTNESPQCLLNYVLQVNPKGWLPSAIVNWASLSQGLNVSRVREYFREVGAKEASAATSKASVA